jgi:hypothetical protein
MDNTFMESLQAALEKAKQDLSYANHLEECGANAGIRKMNANKADWLSKIVYLAELGLEVEKLLAAPEDEQENKPDARDHLIEDLQKVNAQLGEQLTEQHRAYVLEVEYRKELATQAKINWCAEIIKKAHERCWLDGTVLVTSVDYLDTCLLELVRE